MAIARAYLFVPGTRPDRFDKALASGADAVIVDLEDAVAPDQKDAARAAVAEWLASTSRPVVLRINGMDTPWYVDDLALCASPGVARVMLPKAESLGEELLAVCGPEGRRILPLIETARGFEQMPALAASGCVERLVFGNLDFGVDLGIEGDAEALQYFRSKMVLVSRLEGIQPPLDGVTADIRNEALVSEDARRARRTGMGGKLCIHPAQVPLVLAAWQPTEAEVDWARRVLDAFAQARGGAVAVDGRMVDRPVILRAERIIQDARR
ncbi:MAG: CoA ester lyase [Betaproteobacteria bacterium]|nr:CoA ester lyase [Betaproteobacteria bacterium]